MIAYEAFTIYNYTIDNTWNTANCFIPTANGSVVIKDSVSAVEEFWKLVDTNGQIMGHTFT